MPDTTVHFQRSCGVHASKHQSIFFFLQHEGELHDIKQVALMLWLISLYYLVFRRRKCHAGLEQHEGNADGIFIFLDELCL